MTSVIDQPDVVAAAPVPDASFTLTDLRCTRGLLLRDVAAKLNTSQPLVWSYERGLVRPSPRRIVELAGIYGTTTNDWLVRWYAARANSERRAAAK